MGCSIFNSSLFHDLVMNAYQYRCAVTGKVIRYKEGNVDLFNLEAAHIKPQAHQGTFLPCNGIALCRDMHFAFDKGFFCISDDYEVLFMPGGASMQFCLIPMNFKNSRSRSVISVIQFKPFSFFSIDTHCIASNQSRISFMDVFFFFFFNVRSRFRFS